METVFLKLLNMSITASWLVVAVVVLRILLKKAPKAIAVAMWAFVGIRLICPFSFESVLSLIPSAETVPTNIIYSEAPAIQSGITAVNKAVNPVISESFSPRVTESESPMQKIVFAACIIWIIGMTAMLIFTAISCFRVRKRVCEAAPVKDNIWLCDSISTPFIFGVVKPRIYIPSAIRERDTEYVIAHEKAHLKRRDHLWKPLGFLLLTVYWFNPVMWAAYILLCRDIELACDEKVIREMGEQSKKPYSEALINCSVSRKSIAACPLAFGEGGVKGRIRSVLGYKKPAFWIVAVAVFASIALAVGFLTNPTDKDAFQHAKNNEIPVLEADKETNFKYTEFDSKGKESSETPYGAVTEHFEDSKTEVYNKMLNSIDFFSTVELTLETSMLAKGKSTVQYYSDIDKGYAYEAVFENGTLKQETYSEPNSKYLTYVDISAKTYNRQYLGAYSRADTPYIPIASRIYTDKDGIPCYTYRRNITNCPLASYSLVPQEIAFSYLKDFDNWEIADSKVEYLDRACIKISGKTAPYIANKHGSSTFTMLVDSETGMLMKLEGMKNESISNYITVTKCIIDRGLTVKEFDIADYNSYTEVFY